MNDPLLDLARRVGLRAAALVRERRPEGGRVEVAATKSTDTDIVTAIDRECEELIRHEILTARPDDGFLGEEQGAVRGTSGVEWVVDPIDGTVNFVYGIAAYAVSIAARVDGQDHAGYVVNIATGGEWAAVRGQGAWRLGGDEPRRLSVPVPTGLAHLLVATGFGYDPGVRAAQGRSVAALLPQVRDIRRAGAASLDLCAVAEGTVDAYVEQGLQPWDLAAGTLIAREAGARVTGLSGAPDSRLVIASHPAIAGEFADLVRACGF